MRGKILIAIILILTSMPTFNAQAASCPSLRFVFARGSGEQADTDQNYLEFRRTIQDKMKATGLSYDFMDLDYPAIGIGDIGVLLGAAISAGEGNEFGESVKKGVDELVKTVNDTCPGTQYVLGGYSQGAMVISKALPRLNADKVIYAATFGDPKIYLPEGAGWLPPACRGERLSDYRAYVPDCQAYEGIIGGYQPYEPSDFAGKLGTWCNKGDIMCSSKFSISNHVAYVSDGLYEDASKMIYYKVAEYFDLENTVATPHDTAILIDSTGSMTWMINHYKREASRLAYETFQAGGRVALYDYRDLDDPYEPIERCNFNTCTRENFEEKVAEITTAGGGDANESLLSASYHVMKKLSWKRGSTKSLVVLTDADFLSPDRDGMTFDEVVKLSKTIDPVNFYIITEEIHRESYQRLAEATGGKVVTNFDELSLLTDFIMERFDSLPRVEEQEHGEEVPKLDLLGVEEINDSEMKISFETDAEKAIVIVDDVILGSTTEREITISGLKQGSEIRLVPFNGSMRGEAEEIVFEGFGMVVPLTPNTGIPE